MRHLESQQWVKSESEQKDSGLADSQRAALVSLTDSLKTSKPECSDHKAVCFLPTMHLLRYTTRFTVHFGNKDFKNTARIDNAFYPVTSDEEKKTMLITSQIYYASSMHGLSLKPPNGASNVFNPLNSNHCHIKAYGKKSHPFG